MEEFADVFTGLGKLHGILHLEVDETVTSVKIPTRSVPQAQEKLVDKALKRLENLGVIQNVDTPTDWVSALLVVPKPIGKIRLCLDPKPLNAALKRNHYQLPTLEDVLPTLGGARVWPKSILGCQGWILACAVR